MKMDTGERLRRLSFEEPGSAAGDGLRFCPGSEGTRADVLCLAPLPRKRAHGRSAWWSRRLPAFASATKDEARHSRLLRSMEEKQTRRKEKRKAMRNGREN